MKWLWVQTDIIYIYMFKTRGRKWKDGRNDPLHRFPLDWEWRCGFSKGKFPTHYYLHYNLEKRLLLLYQVSVRVANCRFVEVVAFVWPHSNVIPSIGWLIDFHFGSFTQNHMLDSHKSCFTSATAVMSPLLRVVSLAKLTLKVCVSWCWVF